MPRSSASGPAPAPLGEIAIGLRAHTGWAALVALAGPFAAPAVLRRERIELIGKDAPVSRFAYHEAAEAGPGRAADMVAQAEAAAHAAACRAIAAAVAALRESGHAPARAAILAGGGRPLPDLAAILASHALLHAAEGALYRAALAAGCAAAGLAQIEIPERGVTARLAAALGCGEAEAEARLRSLGRGLGPPWGQDQRLAAAASWLALPA